MSKKFFIRSVQASIWRPYAEDKTVAAFEDFAEAARFSSILGQVMQNSIVYGKELDKARSSEYDTVANFDRWAAYKYGLKY